MRALVIVAGLACAIAGCDAGRGARADAGLGGRDAGGGDAGRLDAGGGDAGAGVVDTGVVDTGVVDAGGVDAGVADTGVADTGAGAGDVGVDAWSAPIDAASSGGCISGAVGTRAVRFRWLGSGPGSTAYVDYELNQLPDTSRWHVSAASTSFSYTPIYDDTFLGEGGLDLEGGAFIDVELSTAGLPSVSSATIAIYGRSFDTTASGSFHWQTFDGTGSAPTDLVANSAPYEWYLADATTELPAGRSGALLRIYPGPSSGALIVDRVEICFAE